MAVRSVEEHVDALLQRRVAEGKMAGAPRPDLEAAAVFDSIALNLLLSPRSAVYLMFLARNGLQQAVTTELAAIEALKAVVDDLGNPSFKLQGGPVLRRAEVALLNMESLPRLSADSKALELYGKAVTEFLESHLAKNVRRRGASELARPAVEALAALPSDVASLKELHQSMLSRLYKLAVGMSNFEAAPFSALLGTTTVSRVRNDLVEIISHVEEDGSPEPARDFAVRLLGSLATLATVTSPPSWRDPVVVTEATAPDTAPTAVSSPLNGHFFGTVGDPPFTVSVGSQSLSYNFFPPGPCLLSLPCQLTFPADGRLFIQFENETDPVLQIPLTGTYASTAALAAQISSAQPADLLAAAIGSRVVLYSPTHPALTIAQFPDTDPASWSFTEVSSLVGFSIGQTAIEDQIEAADVATALNELFGSLITASVVLDSVHGWHGVSVVSNVAAPGTSLTLSSGSGFGFNGTFSAQTSSLSLPSADLEHVQVGDQIKTEAGAATTVRALPAQATVTVDPVPTFVGSVTVSSAVVLAYSAFIKELKTFLAGWGKSAYASDLSVLDRDVAPLLASQAPAQRNAAKTALGSLEAELTKLLNVLTNPSTMLPDGAALQEREVVEGILATLTERGFLRAVELLLMGDVAAMLEMDSETASFAGSMMKASSALAAVLDATPTADSGLPDAISTEVW